ncbi:MAG: phosphoglycerate mutase [Pirellulaceae bacterium]|nr:MAG: phosphoglycerate mutase [Pirellulaceae bacterium]
MELILIRHGQSENNARPESERVEDPELTELGRRQARCLGAAEPELFGAQLLITSPFRRALQTAEPLAAARSTPVWVWRDVHEQGGCYAGYTPETYRGRPGLGRSAIAASFPHYVIEPSIQEEGWWGSKPYESWEDALSRAERVARRICDEIRPRFDRVAIVTHADFMRCLLLALAPKGLSEESIFSRIYNTSVTIVQISSPATCRVWNSVRHLPVTMHSW